MKRELKKTKTEELNELIPYAIDFTSYLLLKISGIDRVILHGSVARNDYDSDSDVDLFIDTPKDINKLLIKTIDNYYKTNKFNEWELKGFSNSISAIFGKLDSKDWQDLKRSIMNTGIILYAKYKSQPKKTNQYTLFNLENIKPEKKRVLVYRKLFGFSQNKKFYPGLINKYNAIKVGKGTILVPIEHTNDLKKYLQSKNISPKLYDLWSDEKLN
ncbi:protein containing Nucleotidyltransferase domain [sediment metagenome]|uniref:Protein containing Nucleotidyltransferase domain n=1 Tax=sediment metagenome TaxID=749907 RepID=D9PJD4_9ZZZZ